MDHMLAAKQDRHQHGRRKKRRTCRRDRHSCHALMKKRHQRVADDDLDDPCRRQTEEGRLRISLTSEDGRRKIIDQDPRQSQEKNAQILCRERHERLRHLKQREQRLCDSFAQTGHHDPCGKRKDKRRKDRPMDSLPISLPCHLGDHDIRPDRNTDEKCHDEADDGRIAPDSRHRFLPDKLPHDDGVDGIERLLQHARQCQEQRKTDRFPSDRSMRHIYFFHIYLLPGRRRTAIGGKGKSSLRPEAAGWPATYIPYYIIPDNLPCKRAASCQDRPLALLYRGTVIYAHAFWLSKGMPK